MRSNITHDKMTKMMFGWLPMDEIRRTNRRVDNPTPRDRLVSAMMARMFPGAPGPRRYGHRRDNHDVYSAAMAGYATAGYNGMQAAMAHLAEDMVSDTLLKVLGGSEGRDVWESVFNLVTRRRF